MTKPSLEAVRRGYPDTKAGFDRAYFPYSTRVLGELAFRLTPLFLRAGVGANAITAWAFVALLGALGCLIGGAWSPWWFAVGGLLLHGVFVLDSVDGHVARFRGEESRLGAFGDSFVTWFHYAALPLCLGLGLTLGAAPPEWWVRHAETTLPGWLWIGAGTLRSVSYLLTVIVGERARKLLGVGGYEERVGSASGVVALRAVLEAEALLLVVAPLLGVVGLVHLGYALLHVGVFGAVMQRNLVDLRRRDREGSRR